MNHPFSLTIHYRRDMLGCASHCSSSTQCFLQINFISSEWGFPVGSVEYPSECAKLQIATINTILDDRVHGGEQVWQLRSNRHNDGKHWNLRHPQPLFGPPLLSADSFLICDRRGIS